MGYSRSPRPMSMLHYRKKIPGSTWLAPNCVNEMRVQIYSIAYFGYKSVWRTFARIPVSIQILRALIKLDLGCDKNSVIYIYSYASLAGYVHAARLSEDSPSRPSTLDLWLFDGFTRGRRESAWSLYIKRTRERQHRRKYRRSSFTQHFGGSPNVSGNDEYTFNL
ncbi:hypothetical protein BDZ97DRAFT_1447469 [Flammula alnicola]|nr:hypothetical protein BDZ97DRAFT_1447469 [Flammula alnicola]